MDPGNQEHMELADGDLRKAEEFSEAKKTYNMSYSPLVNYRPTEQVKKDAEILASHKKKQIYPMLTPGNGAHCGLFAIAGGLDADTIIPWECPIAFKIQQSLTYQSILKIKEEKYADLLKAKAKANPPIMEVEGVDLKADSFFQLETLVLVMELIEKAWHLLIGVTVFTYDNEQNFMSAYEAREVSAKEEADSKIPSKAREKPKRIIKRIVLKNIGPNHHWENISPVICGHDVSLHGDLPDEKDIRSIVPYYVMQLDSIETFRTARLTHWHIRDDDHVCSARTTATTTRAQFLACQQENGSDAENHAAALQWKKEWEEKKAKKKQVIAQAIAPTEQGKEAKDKENTHAEKAKAKRDAGTETETEKSGHQTQSGNEATSDDGFDGVSDNSDGFYSEEFDN
jgi:hypothetical protein